MGFTRKTLYGGMMKGIDMKKISSVISLSFLVLFLTVSCEKSSSDWVEYRNEKGYVSSYKKVNIQKDDGNYIVQVWDKYVFSDKGKEIIIQDMKKIILLLAFTIFILSSFRMLKGVTRGTLSNCCTIPLTTYRVY